MAKAPIKTISDKLAKVNDNFSVNMYDNGFMIEVSGQDGEENWESAKIMCSTVDELAELIREVTNMERV
jgi:hypothetical protein